MSVTGTLVVPVYCEAARLAACLKPLQSLREQGWEVVVVDAGSADGSAEVARPWVDAVLQSAKGRAAQMNLGWRQSAGDPVVFLHADTCLPESFASDMVQFTRSGAQWGRFDVQLSGRHPAFAVIGWFINHRSRLTGIATGDQTLFFRRDCLLRLNGFADLPLMEDVELTRRARRLSAPYCVRSRVTTSSRKWSEQGIIRTVLLMWWLRFAYWVGVSPERLHRWYYAR